MTEGGEIIGTAQPETAGTTTSQPEASQVDVDQLMGEWADVLNAAESLGDCERLEKY